MSFSQMSDTTKAMLFMFLGLLVAILLLGYHKSPKASPQLGAAALAARSPNTATSAPQTFSMPQSAAYDETEPY